MAAHLTAAEHARRRQAVIDGDRAGLTRVQVADALGISSGNLSNWARNYMPDAPRPRHSRPGSRMPEAEIKRRLRLLDEAVATDASLASVAKQVGIQPSTLRKWVACYHPTHPILPVYKPKPAPQPAVGIVSSRASLAGWLVSCEPCDRLFVRRERRRADWLAEKHALMHGFGQHVTCRDGSVWRAAA